MPYDYDLFVIGAGSGGVRASRIAAGHGARVGICEDYRVGGTCVIRGCVPKKLLVYGSKFAHEFEDAAAYGWTHRMVRTKGELDQALSAPPAGVSIVEVPLAR